jgi:hypothetical protein
MKKARHHVHIIHTYCMEFTAWTDRSLEDNRIVRNTSALCKVGVTCQLWLCLDDEALMEGMVEHSLGIELLVLIQQSSHDNKLLR